MQMGPLRTAWTFPYTGDELIETCKDLEAVLVGKIDDDLDKEQIEEQELAEYREQLRVAGVRNWEVAKMERSDHSTTPHWSSRTNQSKLKKKLTEVRRYRRQLEHDLSRDPHRLYKLSVDDVTFFEL